jgi:hypothetical protein
MEVPGNNYQQKRSMPPGSFDRLGKASRIGTRIIDHRGSLIAHGS